LPPAAAPADLQVIDRVGGGIAADDPSLDSWLTTYRRQHRHRLAADLRLARERVTPGACLLEYGAVPLLLTAALVAEGYRLSAVDLAPRRFGGAIAELGLDVRRCDVEAEPVPFADRSFDAVLFNELFEHLRIAPIFTLREAFRVLRPGGLLLLSTPNLRSFRGLRNLLLRHRGHGVSGGVYEQYDKLEQLGHMGHVREYTAREVADFLERADFQVEEVIFRGGHGRGLVGVAERLAPTWLPFFTLVARRPEGEGGDR
jgi:SAM-dependent methyltransferase